jgi:hypothetical protein
VLTGPAGCRETIIINGRQITLQANTNVTVDLLRGPVVTFSICCLTKLMTLARDLLVGEGERRAS